MRRYKFVLTLLLVLWCVLIAIYISSANATGSKALHRYQTGKAVGGLQWMGQGHHPSVYKIAWWHHPVNRVYDKRLVGSVRNMKFWLGYPRTALNGNVAGTAFIGFLKGDHRPLSFRLRAGNRRIAAQKRIHDLNHPPVSAKVALLVKDANYLISRANLIGYSQSARMQIVTQRIQLPPLNRYIYEDCSSSVTGLYWLARLPDPNGPNFHYNGYGYTGTLAVQGRVVWRLGQPLSQLRPGDLIFYGGGWPHHHVTMYLGNGRVFSHGTNTGPYNLPVLYRGDAVGAHRYVTVG